MWQTSGEQQGIVGADLICGTPPLAPNGGDTAVTRCWSTYNAMTLVNFSF